MKMVTMTMTTTMTMMQIPVMMVQTKQDPKLDRMTLRIHLPIQTRARSWILPELERNGASALSPAREEGSEDRVLHQCLQIRSVGRTMRSTTLIHPALPHLHFPNTRPNLDHHLLPKSQALPPPSLVRKQHRHHHPHHRNDRPRHPAGHSQLRDNTFWIIWSRPCLRSLDLRCRVRKRGGMLLSWRAPCSWVSKMLKRGRVSLGADISESSSTSTSASVSF